MQDRQELALSYLEEIQNCDDEDRYRVLRDQLYGLGTDVIDLLRVELTGLHFRRRMAAATNLGRLGDTASVVPMITLLNDSHSGVRQMALFALGILGDPAAIEAILSSLTDFDADVRYRAIVALSDLGYPQMEDVLIRAMRDESYGVREQALSQLRSLGTALSMPVVLRALLEREPDMQQMAEEALDRLAPKMTRASYKQLMGELSQRERRLILNYLEARNLQEVYGSLWQRLVIKKGAVVTRGLDKYGRLLGSDVEKPFLTRAWERDDTVDLLVEHFTQDEASRSILLVGEAGSGKTAIVHEFVHRILDVDASWKILETNTSELISGTRYLGDWETKLKEMAEMLLTHEKVIIYMTNPNDLLGAGAHSKSDENFADFFKPYLQRGQLRMIAECTDEAVRNGLSRDPGFLRLFRQVQVPEMTDAMTCNVIKERMLWTKFRGKPVAPEPGCVEQVVSFARSFHTRSAAPGRACDLMDALIDYTSRKETLAEDQPLPLRVAAIPACLSEVSGISLDLLDDSIPLSVDGTRQWFTERLIDQSRPVDAIVNRLAMIKAGLQNPEKPLGIYFLVGPTGVGKTYFSKLVAERLFGDAQRMLRFDLSEYRGRFAVEKLIGSPHDKDREGLLTEAVRNQPFSVLLFDEFEKADSEIYNLFLQIMDEGRLTDARGNTTDFRQTIIILTSNLGASRTSVSSLGFGNDMGGIGSRVSRKMDEFFAPEFLNRLDDIVVFEPLSEGAMTRLVEIEVAVAIARRGLTRRDVAVLLDVSAKNWLAERGFSARFGARELKRVIDQKLLTPLAHLLVSQPTDEVRGRQIWVEAGDDSLVFSVVKTSKASNANSQVRTPER